MSAGDPKSNMPHGAVAFLMTDVEGSTRHWENHPEAMREALIRYARLGSEIVERCNGFLIKNRGAGDSLFIVFASPADALDAAIEFQQALAQETWREGVAFKARMALHCGDVELIEGTYYGVTVNYASRLSSLGHGGQTIASEAFADRLAAIAPEKSRCLRYLGEYALQSGQEIGKVYQTAESEAPTYFPRLRFVAPCPHNLPQSPTRFFGQEETVRCVLASLDRSPILTLLGAGGSGKTRIAIEAGKTCLAYEGEGAWYVDFDPTIGGEAILARALGVGGGLGNLYAFLREKRAIIICDNCKSDPDAALRFALGLRENCPRLRLLMCCAAPLGHANETIFLTPPLATPPKEQEADLARLAATPSVALFTDRITAITPSFRLDAENAPRVAEICRILGGNPYALELVAARYRDTTAETLLCELEAATRRYPEYGTLQAIIDWSYAKLDEPQQTLLQRLSVITGAWTLDAAERVCSDERIELWEVLDFLNELLDRNLVLYEEEKGSPRYRTHHAVKQFAFEKLRATGAERHFAVKHAAYLLEMEEKR